jgi:alkyldihydroxyacetonephosphate synthase
LGAALSFPEALTFFSDRLPEKCLLIVGCEGLAEVSQPLMECMRAIAVQAGAVDLGDGPGRAWHAARYGVSFKQSPVFLLGAYVDTMEISAPWSKVAAIYHDVRRALSARAFVMAHFSHAYLDGCAIYFTFAARHPEDEREHYRQTLTTALSAAIGAGGSLSHHHGVGLAKRAFLEAYHGPLWADFQRIKARFDPDGLFNPGKWDQPASPAAALATESMSVHG